MRLPRCYLQWLLAFAVLFVAACARDISTKNSEAHAIKLYVMDCGALQLSDISAFGLSNDESTVRSMFVPCYLVDHPDGLLLWDAGLSPAIVGLGDVEAEGFTMRYERSVIDQLSDLGVRPDDIDLIALSHLHFDHAGAANYFPTARLLIQESEYQAGFINHADNPVFNYDFYKELEDNPMTRLDGDHDVFGDGSVRLISAPGHSPGHQVLFLDLEETGPLVLSGDLYHFRFSRANQRTPIFNTSREDTLASMAKVEALIESTNATLWIEHDAALAETLDLSPLYYQ